MQQNNQRLLAELQEPRFATIFRSSPIGICITTLQEGTFLDANPAFLKTENLKIEDILGRTSLELGYWHDPLERQKVVQHLLETGAIINCEMSHRLKDGTINHSIRSLKRLTLDGRDCIVTMLTDITEHQRTVEVLRTSEQRFRALIEHSFDAVALVGHDGKFLYGSPSATRITGRSADEWMGQNAFEQIHPDDWQHVTDLFAKLLSKPEQAQQTQFRYRHKDGSWIWLGIAATNLLHEPAVQAIVVNYRDVTERQRSVEALRASEERFSKVFRNSPDSIALVNLADGRLIDVNDQFVELTGYSRDEVLGRTSLEFDLWQNVDEREQFLRLAREPDGVRAFAATIRTKSGESRDMQFSSDLIELDGRACAITSGRDVTAQTRAENALHESEARLRLLVQASNVGLWDWNLLTNDAFLSPEWKQQLGYADHEVANRYEEWESRLHPEDRDRALTAVGDFRAGRRNDYDIEFRLRHKDGSWRWILTRADILHDSAGRPVRMLGCHVDITERKRAEEALVTERLLLRTMADNLPAYVFVKDTARRYRFVNRTHAQQLGLKSEAEILGKTVFDVFPADIARLFDQDSKTVLETGTPVIEREEPYEANGKHGWFLTTKVPLRDTQGAITGLVGIALDITARKQAEAALVEERNLLRTLVDHIPDFIFVKDTQSRQLLNNKANLHLLGAQTDAEVAGKTVFDFYPREQAQRYFDEDQRVMRSGQAQLNQEESVLNHDGEERLLLGSKVPLRDVHGTCIGLVGIKRDITEHRRANIELAASRERLEILSRQLIATQEHERRHLARELHDEIGQALTGIRLNLKALQQPGHSLNSATLVRDTIAVVDQTLQQVRSLALDLRPSMLDEIGLVAALRWCFDRQARQAGFTAHYLAEPAACSASKEIEITCFRVAQESLTNIARHANARNVHLELRQNDTRLELVVQDDGVGFDVAAARDRTTMGASLGLLGMQERVELIGGQLEIESTHSGGTLVRARFPIE